ncbi:MAG: hypothetical protein KCHDKBKB_01549 [Elusimicrobia bacterium]|nr:hypothetical protein [Elusimicrobiota bacterium]
MAAREATMQKSDPRGTFRIFLHPRVSDKKVIIDAAPLLDGFQVGATLAKSLEEVVRGLRKPFWVEPMLYMFGLDPKHVTQRDKPGVRNSLRTVASRYSAFLEQRVGKVKVFAKDITTQTGILQEISENCLEFQRSKLSSPQLDFSQAPLDKYDLLAGDSGRFQSYAVKPAVLIAPFFHIKKVGDDWYDGTLKLFQMSRKFKQQGERLYQGICFTPGCLADFASIERIVRDFSATEADGTFLWVNGFEEEKASPAHIRGLIRLISGLSDAEHPIVKIYGGFLSILLSNYGLSAFSCDLSFKSYRNLSSYRWAPPPEVQPKFYIGPLHRAYKLNQALGILMAVPEFRCQCRLCSEAYGTRLESFVSVMSRPGFCERHFLNVQRNEMNRVASHSLEDVCFRIKDAARLAETSEVAEANHLKIWADTLQDFGLDGGGKWTWKPRTHINSIKRETTSPANYTRLG